MSTDPAEALDADVEGVRSARRAVDDAVLQLVVGRGAGHPAEEFTAVLHQNCGGETRQAQGEEEIRQCNKTRGVTGGWLDCG